MSKPNRATLIIGHEAAVPVEYDIEFKFSDQDDSLSRGTVFGDFEALYNAVGRKDVFLDMDNVRMRIVVHSPPDGHGAPFTNHGVVGPVEG